MAGQYIPRCEDCAFTAGTRANGDELTRLKTKLCVEACEPFYCHEDALELHRNGLPYSEALKRTAMNEPEHLCGGWVYAVLRRHGKVQPEKWRRDVFLALLNVIYDAERDPEFNPSLIPAKIRAEIDAIGLTTCEPYSAS